MEPAAAATAQGGTGLGCTAHDAIFGAFCAVFDAIIAGVTRRAQGGVPLVSAARNGCSLAACAVPVAPITTFEAGCGRVLFVATCDVDCEAGFAAVHGVVPALTFITRAGVFPSVAIRDGSLDTGT